MPIDWVLAGKVALAAGQAFMAYLQGNKDDEERERDREMILAAVAQVRDEILERLNLLELAQLKGELEGFQQIYASYDADPDDPTEEERLRSLIDDSSRVLGRLGGHLDALPGNPELALQAWAIYVPLLYLRAQAMTERQLTYGADEATDALLSFDMAIPRLGGLLAHLRRQSDSRFGPVVCKPIPDIQDSRVCWYRWVHSPNVSEQFVCGSTRDPRGLEKCNASRQTHMDNAYRTFEGVAEITAAADQLQTARDALDSFSALDSLSHHGIDVGDVVVVQGRLARSRAGRHVSAIAADATPTADWFS